MHRREHTTDMNRLEAARSCRGAAAKEYRPGMWVDVYVQVVSCLGVGEWVGELRSVY